MVPRKALCAYCGVSANDRDHVPPKCLFPEPRPRDLITVPACRSCNGGRSAEDEWFKTLLVIRADVQGHSAAQQLLPSVFRSWKRPQAHSITQSLVSTLHDVAIRSPSGLHLCTAPAYLVDTGRLVAYLERLDRGLFFHETSTRLPDKAKVTASASFEFAEALRQEAVSMLDGRTIRSCGGGIFQYVWNHVPDDATTSVWILEFYEHVPFLVITVSETAREAVRSPTV